MAKPFLFGQGLASPFRREKKDAGRNRLFHSVPYNSRVNRFLGEIFPV
jgi:hypothetical protein